MASLTALSGGLSEFEGSGGISNPVAVVAMAVPPNLVELTSANKLAVGKFLGSAAEQNPDQWRTVSPVHYLTPDGPAVVLLHGAEDESVPTTQSTNFVEQYRMAGRSAEVYVLNGAIHSFSNDAPWFNQAIDRAAAFSLTAGQRRRPGRR